MAVGDAAAIPRVRALRRRWGPCCCCTLDRTIDGSPGWWGHGRAIHQALLEAALSVWVCLCVVWCRQPSLNPECLHRNSDDSHLCLACLQASMTTALYGGGVAIPADIPATATTEPAARADRLASIEGGPTRDACCGGHSVRRRTAGLGRVWSCRRATTRRGGAGAGRVTPPVRRLLLWILDGCIGLDWVPRFDRVIH